MSAAAAAADNNHSLLHRRGAGSLTPRILPGAHGYDEIAIDDSVSVRSEVARLTRLYDKVVRNNTMNDRKKAHRATALRLSN